MMHVENPHKNLIGSFILEEPDFVNWIKETFLSSRKEDKEIPQLKKNNVQSYTGSRCAGSM